MEEERPFETLRDLAERLNRWAVSSESGNAGFERAEIDRAVADLSRVQRQLFGPRPRAGKGDGARAKILAYLKEHVEQPVSGEELAAVSGIGEWARRVRELRVQEGYSIRELGRSTYLLESLEPDTESAEAWKSANRIRRQEGSARERIAAFLEENVGLVVTREQLDYVARIKEGSRRVRELRDEHGWPINSHVDEVELGPSEYRLVSADPADRRDPSQRLYPEGLRHDIFERDGYACQSCGVDRSKAEASGDSRFYLEVHHRVAVADELAELPAAELNRPDNLVTLCHRCHLRETEKLQRDKRERRRGEDGA